MDETMPAADAAPDPVTREFTEHRELLFSIAYNILGTVADTEDVLQETWLAWSRADRSAVGNTRAYLVRIAVNESMTRLRTVKRSREAYIGPWLPEPLVTQADAAEDTLRAESVSFALMVVLETLTPLERAVFVLREAFGFAHAEIAAIIGRSPSAVRQLAHRAREHVEARRPRIDVDPALRQEVTGKFLEAATGGDLNALLEVLAPDVTMWTDSGGRTKAARRTIFGRDKVGRLMMADVVRQELVGLTVHEVMVNGEPAGALYDGDRLYAIGLLDITDDGLVRGIYGILNPEKLRRISAAATSGDLATYRTARKGG